MIKSKNRMRIILEIWCRWLYHDDGHRVIDLMLHCVLAVCLFKNTFYCSVCRLCLHDSLFHQMVATLIKPKADIAYDAIYNINYSPQMLFPAIRPSKYNFTTLNRIPTLNNITDTYNAAVCSDFIDWLRRLNLRRRKMRLYNRYDVPRPRCSDSLPTLSNFFPQVFCQCDYERCAWWRRAACRCTHSQWLLFMHSRLDDRKLLWTA